MTDCWPDTHNFGLCKHSCTLKSKAPLIIYWTKNLVLFDDQGRFRHSTKWQNCRQRKEFNFCLLNSGIYCFMVNQHKCKLCALIQIWSIFLTYRWIYKKTSEESHLMHKTQALASWHQCLSLLFALAPIIAQRPVGRNYFWSITLHWISLEKIQDVRLWCLSFCNFKWDST